MKINGWYLVLTTEHGQELEQFNDFFLELDGEITKPVDEAIETWAEENGHKIGWEA